jgi:coenzyme Q-binding protein COQ10
MPARILPACRRRGRPAATVDRDASPVARYETERRVGHSAADMFALVADVESYPQFVPLCERLVVRGRANVDGVDVLIADMTVAFKLIRETFTSRVKLDRPGLKISVNYLDGPFHHLDNRWTFTPLSEDESLVKFWIEYEFKSRTLGLLMGAMFDRAFRKFADAFEARADVVYGTGRAVAAT